MSRKPILQPVYKTLILKKSFYKNINIWVRMVEGFGKMRMRRLAWIGS
jgi:hypothetical protein